MVMTAGASAAVAGDLIAYQGRLTNGVGTPVANGSHSATFAFFADSTGGSALWQEAATVSTTDGLFSYMLGSTTAFPGDLFSGHDALFLEVSVDGETTGPRTRMTAVPKAFIADNLRLTSPAGQVVGHTDDVGGGSLYLNDTAGVATIELHAGGVSDSAVILPDSSINAEEILNEAGVASYKNTSLMDLSTGTMTDICLVDIEIPTAGYIVLYGKCYVLLSGTTGANGAEVQIDEDEGGPALFPYYTRAGMSGFVNGGTNYIPAFVRRVYYKEAGFYEFRLEGMATNALPAVAQTWDHILTAVFYPSQYGYIGAIAPTPAGHPEAVPIILDDPRRPERTGTVYRIDLRKEKDAANSNGAKD